MDKQGSRQLADSVLEDFESGLVLPTGALNLHLSKNATGRTGRLQRRPLTSQSSVSASTSASGSSIIFSSSSDYSASESEDPQNSTTRLGMRLHQHAQAQICAGTAQKGAASAKHLSDGSDNISDDEDERSNTLKANQIPSDFAEQLALSKKRAVRAKESPEKMESSSPIAIEGSQRHQKTVTSSFALQDEDFEAEFKLPASLSKLRLSHASRPRPPQQPIEASASQRTASRSPSCWSLRSSVHARSDTAHSHASSSARKTESSDDAGGDDDFFEGLELPPYLTGNGSKYNTPPSSVDSNGSKKANLQTVLKEKIAARARLFEPEPVPTSKQRRDDAAAHGSKNRLADLNKHIDAKDEPFENSFILDNEQGTAVNRALYSQPTASSFAVKSTEKQHDSLNSHLVSSRISSTRSATTIRHSRSSLLLSEDNIKLPQPDSSRSISSTTRGANSGILRSRPSLSNITNASGSASASKPSHLLRKASANALADAVRAAALSAETARPSSSTAHYAQPTRASLARHQSAFASIGRSESVSRPSTPSAHSLVTDSKAVLTKSPSSNFGSLSRLTRPTIASSAKSHRPTGSDPSGRTSASLGMLVPCAPSSPLKTMKMIRGDNNGSLYRQPRRLQTFGDGSELDAFDDLPVNREKEKRFVKIPVRRRQSSGVASIDSIPSTAGSQKGSSTAAKYQQSGQRERVDSTASMSALALAHPSTRKKISDVDSLRVRRVDNPAVKGESAVIPGEKSAKTGERAGLKLIRNLSATGLSQVQGQMKWNPVLLKWEGNESQLVEFDNVVASSARPALISPLGPLSPHNAYSKSPLAGDFNDASCKQANGSLPRKLLNVSNPHGTTPSLGGVRIVGDMIFDPVKRTWLSMSADGEEELNFGDDEDDAFGPRCEGDGRPLDAWAGGEEMRLRTRRSFANDWNSNASSHGDGEESYWSFEEFSRKQKEAECRHLSEMQAWKTSDAPDRRDLWRELQD